MRLQAVASTAPSATSPICNINAPQDSKQVPSQVLSAMGGAQGLTHTRLLVRTITGGGLSCLLAHAIPLGGGSELSLLDAARRLNDLANLTFKPPQARTATHV
jgi:hypothetical protein